MSAPRHALSCWFVCGHPGEANQGRDADGNSPDDCENRLPRGRRYPHLGNSVRRAVSSEGSRRDIDEDDQDSKPSPWEEGERELANANGCTARHEPCYCATEHSGAGVEGPGADRQANEEGQCEDSEREQQPAEKADADEASSGPKMIMVVVSVR